jgi:hypothetical protein
MSRARWYEAERFIYAVPAIGRHRADRDGSPARIPALKAIDRSQTAPDTAPLTASLDAPRPRAVLSEQIK